MSNMDLISRRDAIDALWKALYDYEDKTEKQFLESEELNTNDWFRHRIFVQNMSGLDLQSIINLPSAKQWIPCSERLPDQEGEYLVTFNDEWRGPKVRTIWYGTPFDIIIDRDKWVFYCDKEYGFEIFAPGKHIVAWMELPKPYNDEHERGE